VPPLHIRQKGNIMKRTVIHCEHNPETHEFKFECGGEALSLAYMLGVVMARVLSSVPERMRLPFQRIFEAGWKNELKGSDKHGKTEADAGDP